MVISRPYIDIWPYIANFANTGVKPLYNDRPQCRVPAVVIFCNIFDPQEMKLVKVLNSCITELGDNAPPTILVPHVPSRKSFLNGANDSDLGFWGWFAGPF